MTLIFMTNFRIFYVFSIENQHVQFKVDPNPQDVDAAKVAEVLGKFPEKRFAYSGYETHFSLLQGKIST